MGKPTDLVQGTGDLLIRKNPNTAGPLPNAFNDRLEQRGSITAKWKETDTGRQAKFYSLTAAGGAQLEKEPANWSRLSAAINLAVETT